MKTTDVIALKAKALDEAGEAADAAALDAVRIKYLSRKGLLQEVMKSLKDLTPEERPAFGQSANELKVELSALVEERKAGFQAGKTVRQAEAFDYTLPGRWPRLGSRHPISQMTERIVAVFRTMGFTVASGPDIETVYHNFDALNTPADHPSRDPQDTFYLEDGSLLRCHTSPVQVRYMEQHQPPIRIVAPGRCYRRDTPDATHSANFHQVEGLYVNEDVSLADLKGDIAYFARQIMGRDAKIRFRPHFFPFTEPSVEVDFSCHACHGKGCRICKQSGWIEIMGAGMVHPTVLQQPGYDTEKYTGYAFGMGVERITMILYGIKDIRMLYENDIRFLAQF